MKFIIHNLRMIWAHRRYNGWVLAELFLVFVVMWFLCDSLGCLKYTFYRPLGYNIDHVYSLEMIKGGESRDSSLTNAHKCLSILEKLEKEPAVEAAVISFFSLPMSGTNSYSTLYVKGDSAGVNMRNIVATGGYTRVFRMHEEAAHPFAEMPTDIAHIMLSESAIEQYREEYPGFSPQVCLYAGDTTHVIRQYGSIGRFRTYRYGEDARWAFARLSENDILRKYPDLMAQITFRVKEQADGPDFRVRFQREIAPRLDTDNLSVVDAVPYTQQQLQFEVMVGDVDKVNSQTVVVIFLLVNVFLGLVGTFWFRTRRRRAEIALRMAMGSTTWGVFRLLVGEGLLLLSIVALPAMLVCYQIGVGEFTIGRTALISSWPIEWSFLRFLLGSAGAWLLIACMVALGIWYPARKAMRISSAEALNEE